jgi:hypothetical protein
VHFQNRCNKLSLVSVQKVHSSVSFKPHLKRKEFVAVILWESLNWKFWSLVFLVVLKGKDYIFRQSSFIIDKYCYNGVFFINDIISEDKQFLSYQEFQNKYMISTNFLEYYGMHSQNRCNKLSLVSVQKVHSSVSFKPHLKRRVCGSSSMGKFLKFSFSCSPKRGRINILPIIYLYSSRILWYCGCSPKGMEKTYLRVWEAAWY